jgi:hypothetical protein
MYTPAVIMHAPHEKKFVGNKGLRRNVQGIFCLKMLGFLKLKTMISVTV